MRLVATEYLKSGEAITTPLVFGREGDSYIIVASKGGAPKHPTWFGNLKANPEVDVEGANAVGTDKSKPGPDRLRAGRNATGFSKKCRRSGPHLLITRRARTA